ncbi:hypothetical protein DEDE109153_15110 [Deinococcus deserti]
MALFEVLLQRVHAHDDGRACPHDGAVLLELAQAVADCLAGRADHPGNVFLVELQGQFHALRVRPAELACQPVEQAGNALGSTVGANGSGPGLGLEQPGSHQPDQLHGQFRLAVEEFLQFIAWQHDQGGALQGFGLGGPTLLSLQQQFTKGVVLTDDAQDGFLAIGKQLADLDQAAAHEVQRVCRIIHAVDHFPGLVGTVGGGGSDLFQFGKFKVSEQLRTLEMPNQTWVIHDPVHHTRKPCVQPVAQANVDGQ